MNRMIIYIALLLLFSSCNAQVDNNKNKEKIINIDTDKRLLDLVMGNKDIIGKCIFSIEKAPINNETLDINVYDSLISLVQKDSMFALKFIEIKIDNVNREIYLEKIQKWCYCYRVLESVFVFDKRQDLYFESIASNLSDLDKILNKYISPEQTIDAMTTSQAEMFFLESVNYVSNLDAKSINSFFAKYFYLASKIN